MEVHRQLNVEEYVALLLRRRWLILIAAVLGTAAGLVLSVVLPPQYTSHTMVLIEEPVVSDSYVKPVVNEDVNQRLASMQGQILSRTRLEDLVEKFHPYPKEAGRMPIEAMLEDRLDRAVGAGADVETAVTGRLQPV